MKKNNNRSGFSLIELLIALSILTIGLLGVIPLSIATIRLNNLQNQMNNAKYLAETHSEMLRSISFDSPDLQHIRSDSLGDTLNFDHRDVRTLDNVDYTIFWNIQDNVDGTKTVRTIIRWNFRGVTREYQVEMVRSRYEL